MVDKPSKLRIETSVPERVIERKKLGDGAQTGRVFRWKIHEKLCVENVSMSHTLQSRSTTFEGE